MHGGGLYQYLTSSSVNFFILFSTHSLTHFAKWKWAIWTRKRERYKRNSEGKKTQTIHSLTYSFDKIALSIANFTMHRPINIPTIFILHASNHMHTYRQFHIGNRCRTTDLASILVSLSNSDCKLFDATQNFLCKQFHCRLDGCNTAAK